MYLSQHPVAGRSSSGIRSRKRRRRKKKKKKGGDDGQRRKLVIDFLANAHHLAACHHR
jgi:hypothetical protein